MKTNTTQVHMELRLILSHYVNMMVVSRSRANSKILRTLICIYHPQ